MGEISYLMGFCCVLLILAPIGHGVWVLTRTLLEAIFGSAHREKPEPRSRSCPGCRDSIRENAEFCPSCGLRLEGQLARHLNRLRQAQREVRAMADREELDRETAEQVAARLETRIRALCEGDEVSPARPRLRAMPVDELPAQTTSPRDLSPIEALPVEASVVEAEVLASVPESPTPRHGVLSAFMEEKNILWGELVGGVLIVGCSIALVLTLWRDLQDLPYSSFFLAAAITAALFGAGQYTLHHWKLAATSRGLLVIALLLVPLNLLVLADPGVGATSSAIDVAIKIAAILAFVGMVRTAGRDLIGTDLLPGPIDRRWLLSLAVVGAPATQIIPVEGDAFLHVWLPLVCRRSRVVRSSAV